MVSTYTSKEPIKRLIEKLIETCKSKSTETKIVAIDKTCENLVDDNITPSITLVVRHLKQDAIKISPRSIYNQRDGGNPYREVIDAWTEFLIFKTSRLKTKTFKENEGQNIIEEKDLAAIDDPVLRHRVSLLFGELKGLRNQLNIAREVQNLPMVGAAESGSKFVESSTRALANLNHYEIEILNDFLNGSSNAVFDEEGALAAKFNMKRGERISSPGLKDAFEKLINNH
jgi:hypothetical protein